MPTLAAVVASDCQAGFRGQFHKDSLRNETSASGFRSSAGESGKNLTPGSNTNTVRNVEATWGELRSDGVAGTPL
jgi:hypothetical protein